MFINVSQSIPFLPNIYILSIKPDNSAYVFMYLFAGKCPLLNLNSLKINAWYIKYIPRLFKRF